MKTIHPPVVDFLLSSHLYCTRIVALFHHQNAWMTELYTHHYNSVDIVLTQTQWVWLYQTPVNNFDILDEIPFFEMWIASVLCSRYSAAFEKSFGN